MLLLHGEQGRRADQEPAHPGGAETGHQPGLAERYITTGSLYLCSAILLPLGLPETSEFWSAPSEPWTSVKAWSGKDLPADHALDLR